MEWDWAIILATVAGAGAIGLIAWTLRSGDARRSTAAVVAAVAGFASGLLILSASSQSGIASTAGFGLSLLLGTTVIALAIFGIAARQYRTTAFVCAAVLALSALAASQLTVAISGA